MHANHGALFRNRRSKIARAAPIDGLVAFFYASKPALGAAVACRVRVVRQTRQLAGASVTVMSRSRG